MNRRASADEVFRVFDQRIEDYLKRNRKAVETEYKSSVGRPVDDGEIDSFISSLGDSLYSSLKIDPSHLAKFVDFYVNDAKLSKAVSEAIEQAASYAPSRAASDLRRLAASLDSSRRPSLRKLSSAVSDVLRRLG